MPTRGRRNIWSGIAFETQHDRHRIGQSLNTKIKRLNLSTHFGNIRIFSRLGYTITRSSGNGKAQRFKIPIIRLTSIEL